jgi:hypothetical protein
VLVHNVTSVHELKVAYPVFTSLSTIFNIILAALIIFRLVYHRRHARNALGAEHGSPYTNIITMCVESSTLMVVACGLYTILRFMDIETSSSFMFPLLPQICVGGLKLDDIWCTAQIFDTTRLSHRSSSSIVLLYVAPHHQHYCQRSKRWTRFGSTFHFQTLPIKKERCDIHISVIPRLPPTIANKYHLN